MFCCNRLTPLEFGETYTLRDQDIQKHGIDVEEKTSSLPVYGDSKFKVEETVVVHYEDIPRTRLQRIGRCCAEVFCVSCLFFHPQEPFKIRPERG